MGCGGSKPSPVYDDLQTTGEASTIDDAAPIGEAETPHGANEALPAQEPAMSIDAESNPSSALAESSLQASHSAAAPPTALRLLPTGSRGPACVLSAAMAELSSLPLPKANNMSSIPEQSDDRRDSPQASARDDVDPTPSLSLVAPNSAHAAALGGSKQLTGDATNQLWKAQYGLNVAFPGVTPQQGLLNTPTFVVEWPSRFPLFHILSFGPADCSTAVGRLRAVARWAATESTTNSTHPPCDCPWDLLLDLCVYMGMPSSAPVFAALAPWTLQHMESSLGAGDVCRSISDRIRHATRFPSVFKDCTGSVTPLAGMVAFLEALLRSDAMRACRRTLPAAVIVALLQACNVDAMPPAGHPLHAEFDDDDDEGEASMRAWGAALRSARWLPGATAPAPGGGQSSDDVVAGAGEVLLAGLQLAVASGNLLLLRELLSVLNIDPDGGDTALLDCPPDVVLLLQTAGLVDIAALHGQDEMFEALTEEGGALRLRPWQWGSSAVLCAAAGGSLPCLMDILAWQSQERRAQLADERVASQANTSSDIDGGGALSGATPPDEGLTGYASSPAVCPWGEVDVQSSGWAALPIAASLGHTGVVEQLLRFVGERGPSFWVAAHTAFLDACRHGRCDVLRALLRGLPSLRQVEGSGGKSFDEHTGRPFFLDVRVANDAAVFHAVSSGSAETLQCVLSEYEKLTVLPPMNSECLSGLLAPLGSLSWVHRHRPKAAHRTAEQAADTTHVEKVLALLRPALVASSTVVPQYHVHFLLGIRTLVQQAAALGNASMVLALLQTEAGTLHFDSRCLSLGWTPPSSSDANLWPQLHESQSVLAAACSSGNMLLVPALLAIHSPERDVPQGCTSWSHRDLEQAALQASRSGDLSVLQLLCRWGKQYRLHALPNQEHLHACFLAACAHGWLHVLQFLQALPGSRAVAPAGSTAAALAAVPPHTWLQPLASSTISQGLQEASLWGHEHVVSWLLRHRSALLEEGQSTPVPSASGLSRVSSGASLGGGGCFEPLMVACSQGYTAVIQCFAELRGDQAVDFAAHSDALFLSACQGGRAGAARMLVNLPVNKGEGVNMNTRDDKPFVEACIGGHLHLARWLLAQSGANRVDAAADDSAAFLGACRSGCLPLVLLLAGRRGRDALDVTTGDSFALVAAAEANHAHVLQWLLAQQGARELDVSAQGYRAVAAAARLGATEALQVFLSCGGERQVPAQVLNEVLLPSIAAEGHLEAMRVLLSLPSARGVDVHAEGDQVYLTAYANGCVDLLSLLHTLPGHVWPGAAELQTAMAGLESDSDSVQSGTDHGVGPAVEGGGHEQAHRGRSGSESMQDSDSTMSGREE